MNQISSQVIDLCARHIGNFKIRNGQAVAKVCPFCNGGDNHDTDTFAVGLHNGMYNCKRGSCGKHGTFRDLCEFFGERFAPQADAIKPIGAQKKTWDKPDPEKLLPLTEDAITYMARRKISQETLEKWHISCDEKGNIVFPFYRDGVLTFVKYRRPKRHEAGDGPKEWQDKNTQPILFGMDQVSWHKPLFITEGEIDALSLYEAGVTNVVSVPSGCCNMDWIPECWDWLEQFQQIVLFGDNDQPGLEMISTLTKRLGEDRCMIVPEYPQVIYNGKDYNRTCKDANEILFYYGQETLAAIADACEPAPVQGMLNVASVPFVDPSQLPRIYTRIPALDAAIGGFGEGGLTILSGKRGEGKSTIAGNFLLNAIEQGYSCAAYSGELSAYKFLEWIMLQACESKYITIHTDARSGKRYPAVPQEIQDKIRAWIDGKLFLYDNAFLTDDSLIDSIINVFTICARRFGCKLFLVDNLMMLCSGLEEEIKAQAKITSALKAFAVKFKAHIILVAHPRKLQGNTNFTNDDVSGNSAITNLSDNVFSIEKPNIRVTKNREFGDTPYIECSYNPANRRIFQTSTGDKIVYSWDHRGVKTPEDQACVLPEFQVQAKKQEPQRAYPF